MPDKSSKKTTSNIKLLLPTPLGQELLGYAKESKPVLLHGKDSVGRLRDLIQPIHFILNCGGSVWGRDTEGLDYFDKEKGVADDGDSNDVLLRNVYISYIDFKLNHQGGASFGLGCCGIEYIGEEVFQSSDIYREFLAPEIRKAIEDRNHKRIFELLRDTRCSSNKFTRFDCQLGDGKTVFEELANYKCIAQRQLIEDYTSRMDEASLFCLEPYTDSYSSDTSYIYKPLLWNARTLFIDNLKCSKNDLNDDRDYDKLALKIEEGKKRGRERDQWLVAYAYDCTTFPRQFRGQFEEVPLDGKDHEVKGAVVVPVVGIPEAEGLRAVGNSKDKGEYKSKEYLRLDGSGCFYAKLKGGVKEEKLKLSTKTQEYKVLRYLYSICGTNHNKATVKDLLIAGGIQSHETGQKSYMKKKTAHLRRVIADIRTVFNSAGLKKSYLADEGDDPTKKRYYLLISIEQ
jgi:hypothetical protein